MSGGGSQESCTQQLEIGCTVRLVGGGGGAVCVCVCTCVCVCVCVCHHSILV